MLLRSTIVYAMVVLQWFFYEFLKVLDNPKQISE
jgi:hypothetical protein